MGRGGDTVRQMPQVAHINPSMCVTASVPSSKGSVVQKRSSVPVARSARVVESQPALTSIVQTSTYLESAVNSRDGAQRLQFYHDLQEFMASIGNPIQRLPTLGFKELDLWILYKEVTKRRGVDAVIAKKQWKEVADALNLPASCTDSGFRLRLHYTKYLEQYERSHFTPPPEIPTITGESRPRKASVGPLDRKRKLSGKTSGDLQQQSFSDSYDNMTMSPLTSCESPEVRSPAKKHRASPITVVDFSKLEETSLQRYRKRYQLQAGRKMSKQELVSAVTEHFAADLKPVQEEEQTLLNFLSALRRRELTA